MLHAVEVGYVVFTLSICLSICPETESCLLWNQVWNFSRIWRIHFDTHVTCVGRVFCIFNFSPPRIDHIDPCLSFQATVPVWQLLAPHMHRVVFGRTHRRRREFSQGRRRMTCGTPSKLWVNQGLGYLSLLTLRLSTVYEALQLPSCCYQAITWTNADPFCEACICICIHVYAYTYILMA